MISTPVLLGIILFGLILALAFIDYGNKDKHKPDNLFLRGAK
jgi:hypothetical protein